MSSVLTQLIKNRSESSERHRYIFTRNHNVIVFMEYALLLETILLIYTWRDSFAVLLRHIGW